MGLLYAFPGRDRSMVCIVHSYVPLYCVDNHHIHHHLLCPSPHIQPDQNDSASRDYCTHKLWIIEKLFNFFDGFESFITVNYFCRHWYCGQWPVSMERRGKSHRTVRN